LFQAPPEKQRHSPYQGLVPYSEKDAPYFFGRKADTRILVSSLYRSSVALVYGQSGVGKSSVLRAGLIPELNRKAKAAEKNVGSGVRLLTAYCDDWRKNPSTKTIASINSILSTAGETPVKTDSLLEVFKSISSKGYRIFLILDQFEEFFNYEPGHPNRSDFINQLVEAYKASRELDGPRLSLMISLREDALARLDVFKGRISQLFSNRVAIEALDHDAAREAIIGPLEKYRKLHPAEKLVPDPGEEFIEQILEDCRRSYYLQVGSYTGASRGVSELQSSDERVQAALLQMVLTRLWEERRHTNPPSLSLEIYDRFGGNEGSGATAIAKDFVASKLNDLSQEDRAIAAAAIQFLVTQVGKFAVDSISLAELTKLPRPKIERVLNRLAEPGCWIIQAKDSSRGENAFDFQLYHDLMARGASAWRDSWLEEQSLREEEFRRKKMLKEQETDRQKLLIEQEEERQRILEESKKEQERRSAEFNKRAKRLRKAIFSGLAVVVVLGALSIVFYRLWNKAEVAQGKAEVAQGKAEVAQGEAEGLTAMAVAAENEANRQREIAECSQAKAEGESENARKAESDAKKLEDQAWKSAKETADLSNQLASLRKTNSKLTSDINARWNHALTAIRTTNSKEAWNKLAALTDENIGSFDLSSEAISNPLLLKSYAGNKENVWDTAISRDLKWIASAGEDMFVRLWNINGELKIKEQASNSKKGVVSVGFTPDPNQVLAGSSGKRFSVFDVPSGTLAVNLPFHDNAVLDISTAKRGSLMASASEDGTAAVWKVQSKISKEKQPLRKTLKVGTKPVTQVRFSEDERLLVTSSSDSTVQIFNTDSGERTLRMDTRAITRNCQFSPTDSNILAGGSGEKVMIVNAEKEWLFLFDQTNAGNQHEAGVTGVAFSETGEYLSSIGADGRCLIWDIRSVSENSPTDRTNYPAFVSEVDTKIRGRLLDVIWNKDLLILGGEDGLIEGWDLSNVRIPQPDFGIAAHSGPIRGMTLIESRNQLLSWSAKISSEIPTAKGKATLFLVKESSVPDPLVKLWNLEFARHQSRWEGDWEFTFEGQNQANDGLLSLTPGTQDASMLGSFRFGKTDGTIRGELSHNGKTLTGTWADSSGERGRIAFELREDLKSFKGGYSMKIDVDPGLESENKWTGSKLQLDLASIEAKILAGTTIAIYVEEGDKKSIGRALEINEYLDSIVPDTTEIDVRERGEQYFKNQLVAKGDEIRWDTEAEGEQAETLAALLNRQRRGNKLFSTRKIRGGASPNFISVFFAK